MLESSGRSAHRPAQNRVTIVVPVYGDWKSLRECVASLIKHADPAEFDVLLVNDSGPDADEIEAGLRGMIYGHANIRYERNSTNLGFVQTCNRAVYDLDHSGNDVLLLNSDTQLTAGALQEMRAVLELSPRHGVVCPRSNDATIATIPFFRRRAHEARTAQRSIDVFTNTLSLLPRFYLSPVAVGFCFLVRRSLIDEYGLFDEIFGRGYSEENDFCLRVNDRGYSSLIANHAFVYHEGSSNFGTDERARLDEAHSQIVRERYPHYPASVVAFIHHDYAAADRFADLMVPDLRDPTRTVLIDLRNVHDPTGHEAAGIAADITTIVNSVDATTRVTIATRSQTIGDLELSTIDVDVVHPDQIEQVFDLGVALNIVTNPQQLAILNRHCLRWLVIATESNAFRSWARRTANPARNVVARLTLKHADTVVWKSDEQRAEVQNLLGVNGQTSRTVLGSAAVGDEIRRLLETRGPAIDPTALDKRNSQIGDVALLDEAARRQREFAALDAITSSGSYKLSRKISAISTKIRRLGRS